MKDDEFMTRYAKMSLFIKDNVPNINTEFEELTEYVMLSIGQLKAHRAIVTALMEDPYVKKKVHEAAQYNIARVTVDKLFKGKF